MNFKDKVVYQIYPMTPTATAWAICGASPPGWITWPAWGWITCG